MEPLFDEVSAQIVFPIDEVSGIIVGGGQFSSKLISVGPKIKKKPVHTFIMYVVFRYFVYSLISIDITSEKCTNPTVTTAIHVEN